MPWERLNYPTPLNSKDITPDSTILAAENSSKLIQAINTEIENNVNNSLSKTFKKGIRNIGEMINQSKTEQLNIPEILNTDNISPIDNISSGSLKPKARNHSI